MTPEEPTPLNDEEIAHCRPFTDDELALIRETPRASGRAAEAIIRSLLATLDAARATVPAGPDMDRMRAAFGEHVVGHMACDVDCFDEIGRRYARLAAEGAARPVPAVEPRTAECDRHPKGVRCVCRVHTSPLDCDPPVPAGPIVISAERSEALEAAGVLRPVPAVDEDREGEPMTECVFVPAHEPWQCNVHNGIRTSLIEEQCDIARPAEPFNYAYLANIRHAIEQGRNPGSRYTTRRLLATIDALRSTGAATPEPEAE